MSKKSFIISLIALMLFLSCIILFITMDSDELPVIKNSGDRTSGFAVYTKEGDIIYANIIESIKKTISGGITVKTDSLSIQSPIGIIENPPQTSITDIYSKAFESMGNDKNVLIIYIDGLGYEIYKKALKAGIIPSMASLGTAKKSLTVYPSITDVTFASMVTGSTPKYTGIHNREKKPLPIPTIFDKAAESGKIAKIIEGNMQIIIDEADTVLNIDENKNGTIDDEIYEKALEELKNPPSVLLIHFHSYDDFAHKYGPSSQEALSCLGVLDSYIGEMLRGYVGDLIITSDHGMHDEGEGGAHGTFSEADLFIPIIMWDNIFP